MHTGLYCVYGPKADGRDFHIIPSHKHATRSHWQVVKAAQIRNFNISYFVLSYFMELIKSIWPYVEPAIDLESPILLLYQWSYTGG